MIYVILPAFNEEKGIGLVLEKIISIASSSKDQWKVVVVDDGSKDRTSEIARSFERKLNLSVIQFSENRGVGEVFREGFTAVCQSSSNPDQDICILLDSDNTQDPTVMLPMIEKIRAGSDIVIASRFEGNGTMIGCPWQRQMFSYGVSWLLRILANIPTVKDYSTFYRAYRISVLRNAITSYGDNFFSGKGFAVAAGMLLKLGNLTRKFAEVPLILRYDFKAGTSGNKILRTINGYLNLITEYLVTNRFRDKQEKTV